MLLKIAIKNSIQKKSIIDSSSNIESHVYSNSSACSVTPQSSDSSQNNSWSSPDEIVLGFDEANSILKEKKRVVGNGICSLTAQVADAQQELDDAKAQINDLNSEIIVLMEKRLSCLQKKLSYIHREMFQIQDEQIALYDREIMESKRRTSSREKELECQKNN